MIDRLERICLLQPHIETETEGTKTLLFINIRSYNERSDGSYIPKNKTDFLTILSLMLSCYFQEKQRSFTFGDFWYYPDGRSLISSFSRSSKMAAMSNSRPWGRYAQSISRG